MKNLISLLIFFFICKFSFAIDRYVSPNGNDLAAGTTPLSAWQTLSKVNSSFASFSPGDRILFERGGTWYGALTITRSGSSGAPITIGAYTGALGNAKPLITGFTTISNATWSTAGTNLWTHSAAVTDANLTNMVTIGGAAIEMGRWPNKNTQPYRTIGSIVSGVSITDPTLSGTPDWDGGQLVIRKVAWVIGRETITNHTGTTITYANNSPYGGSPGYGYFIENHILTLDQQNEWYWNNSTKKLTVYSTTSPLNVKVSSRDILININQFDYITVDNIAFEGANVAAINFGGAAGQSIFTTITNCSFDLMGRDAIYGTNNNLCTINSNTIYRSWNNGIYLENESDSSRNATVKFNNIRVCGISAGMGFLSESARYSFSHSGIVVLGDNANIRENVLDSIGYNPISIYYNNSKANYNLITNYNFTKDDGAGIYAFDIRGNVIETGREISYNIIINGIGAGAGKPGGGAQSMGIYTDDKADGIIIHHNSISGTQTAGIYIHNSTFITVRDNTVYNSTDVELTVHDAIAAGFPVRNIAIKNNIYFARTGNQYIRTIRTILNDIPQMYSSMDSNIYARPMRTTGRIIVQRKVVSGSFVTDSFTLAQWKAAYPAYDVHTTFSSLTASTVNDIRFEYNATLTPKSISLGAIYADARGNSYSGAITLQPFTSAVLVRTGPLGGNIPPNANAGPDQSITVPASSVTLTGSGTDADGTIVSYSWLKIFGPAAGTVSSPNSQNTNVINLVQGSYQFQLTITDNNGATDKDTVQIVVVPNQSPSANAGLDKVITLPTNNTTANGSGNDPDGTITGYAWVQLAGPNTATLGTPTAATTTVTGLIQGTYNLQLTVTDNGGLTGTDIMQITVNPAPNVVPIADAGINQTITLPTNTATLNGTGSTDPDGTIVSYLWEKISGPTGGTITSPTSATSGITALQQGNYVYQLTVTDNGGMTDQDIMNIVVNPAANVGPTADAGVDQIITLPTSTTSVNGNGSTDPDGTITGYAWTKISGPTGGNITSPSSVSTNITALQQGTYLYRLIVTDNNGDTGGDLMQIVVNPANVAPTANAGSDQSITLPTSTATLNGSGTDPDGTITGYLWTKISGPTGGTITSPTAASTGITALQQGTYVYSLRVTDNDGATGDDFMQIVVSPANIAPTANAGSDQVITLPVNTTTLVGSGTDPDGTIVSYSWVKISGPAGGTVSSPSSSTTGIINLQQGNYIYRLIVTDDEDATGIDFVQVLVEPAIPPPNEPPTANAGVDKNITLPVSTTTVNGSGNDPDGTIVGYFWTKISGPAGGNITSPSAAATGITGLATGVYIYKLRVTDNNGDTATDAMQVTVNPANIAPTANAGTDQFITLPTSTTTLTGSGTDPDGTITGYLWRKLSGPAGGTIATPTTASTNISALQAGVYVFQLRVTDNIGDTATDAVQVTVNAANIAPTADAGVNQIITLPTNSTTLVGSGTDPDGTITAYLWTKITGTGSTIVSPTASTTNITGLTQGVYIYELRVTDNSGDTATDAIQITVNAAPLLPVADAGEDQVLTMPNNSTNLIGSGTDADGTIVGYSWTQISGPSQSIIISPTTASTGITDTTIGTYVYLLTVTDNNGDTASDAVQVTLNAAPININPVADAGGDQSISLPTNTVTLTGSGTDEDGTVVSYSWSGTGGTIISPNASTTVITNLTEGIHTFTLTVTDNNGNIGIDIMQVTVYEVIVISSFPLKGYKVISN